MLTKVCKNRLCPINLNLAAAYNSLSKIKTIEQSIFCTNTIMQKHTPCSTGKFHHHQIPMSELQQGQVELTSPKILHGCCCHPRISTLCLHSGRQWVLGGDWPVSINILSHYFGFKIIFNCLIMHLWYNKFNMYTVHLWKWLKDTWSTYMAIQQHYVFKVSNYAFRSYFLSSERTHSHIIFFFFYSSYELQTQYSNFQTKYSWNLPQRVIHGSLFFFQWVRNVISTILSFDCHFT
jgi:hypothetical protein